jgi:DNA-directed RNA polymerase subunit RPC12/RpoP
MTGPQLADDIQDIVTEMTKASLAELPLCEMASLTEVQALGVHVAEAAGRAVFAAWSEVLVAVAKQMGLSCPACGHRRKCKTRPKDPLRICVLGTELKLPKLYLECGHCDAPGVSIIVLLTGLSSGEASLQLKLNAAYFAAKHSYGEAQKDMAAHYGQDLERTKLRRMALQVEQRAVAYSEKQRADALQRLSGEARTRGVSTLMVEADGGMIRTGQLVDLDPEDPGYGEKTKRDKPRRKRPTQFRELITMDVREPGLIEPTSLDVLVPVCAPTGERSRRLLALAGRAGLGDNTKVKGLGDLGSGLPAAFDEAFVGYQAEFSADWKHICDYVWAAKNVLCGLDADQWAKQMKAALWDRDAVARDKLLAEAQRHRLNALPKELDGKSPVKALSHYVKNNWHRMHAKERKAEGLPFVSARAEAQVRDRSKKRFNVAGVWKLSNLEPKATLRTIIHEGEWDSFKRAELEREQSRFAEALSARLQQAVHTGRLDSESLPGADQPQPASDHADNAHTNAWVG